MSVVAAATCIAVAALCGVLIGRRIQHVALQRRNAAMQRTINALINTERASTAQLAAIAWALDVYETSGDPRRLIYSARQSAHKTQEHHR